MSRRLLPFLPLLAALVACASTTPHPPTTTELVGTWQLAASVPMGARLPTLNCGADGSISGNGGVNRFRGTIDAQALDHGRWQASVTSTRMAGTAEAMALEQDLLHALQRADRAELAGDQLRLLHGTQPLAIFVRLRW